MTALAAGQSTTITVGDGGTIKVSTNGGFASAVVTPVVGAAHTVSFGPMPTRRSLGPYTEGATIALTNQTVDSLDYDGAPNSIGVVISSTGNEANGMLVGQVAAVKRSAVSGGGLYLGAAFPKRMRRGTYGRLVAGWSGATASPVGLVSFPTGDLPPFADNATKCLELGQDPAVSRVQQSCEGGQFYMPLGRGTGPAATPTTGGYSVGVWVKNPGVRTLNFYVQIFNAAANRSCMFNCAAEPGDWRFITVSPTQDAGGTWQRGVDSVNLVRLSQKDDGAEGPWQVGERLRFSNVYVDCAARPRFLLNFDDGYSTQRYPFAGPIISGTANVTSTAANVLTTATAHGLVIGAPIQFTDTAPTSLALGTTYWVQTVPSSTSMTLTTDASLQNVAATTGFAGLARWSYAGTQDRSVQQIVESYGFRGSLFPVGAWMGTTGKYGYGGGSVSYLSASDILAMWNDGWAVGSHSNTHPSNADGAGAGLRLLGPYGYYLSNPFDNLPAQYLTNFGITSAWRKRVTAGTQASPSVFTTENPHQFLINQPIVFTDVAPTGCQLGVTYFVRTVPTTSTFTLATDQGTLVAAVNNTTGAFSGTCNYRHPGSALDDSGIYADIVAGAEAYKAIGITTAYKFFALPQGGWDQYVRSACIRAGFQWVRGITTPTTAHTITVGYPSGGGFPYQDGGWMQQLDCVQTDGVIPLGTPDANAANGTLTGYVNETITQGACGCSYHHALSPSTLIALDRLCSYLRVKSDLGQIDVLTCDEVAKELGF